MLSNYLKSILRGILRSKSIVLINVFGFAVSLACCIVMALYIQHETAYDRHNKNLERIYRVCLDRIYPERNVRWARIAPGTIQGVVEFPEVESAVRISPGETNVTAGNQKGFDEPVITVDSTFLNIFTVDFVAGNPATALADHSSVILTRQAAAKYFPSTDALGKTISLGPMGEFKVAGIVEDPPATAHFHYKFIVPMGWNRLHEDLTAWGTNFGYLTYILLSPNACIDNLSEKLPEMSKKYLSHSDPDYAQWRSEGNDYRFFLQPLKDIHLKSDLRWEAEPNGNYQYLFIFGSAGFLILVIACINFMNLSTARYTTKAREVGIRKILGSYRFQLAGQFLLESLLLSAGAIILASTLAKLLLPAFNTILNKNLELDLSSPVVIAWLASATVLVGLLAGSYPAIMLSSFRPAQIIGNNSIRAHGSGFRNKLVVTQFVISFFLIAGTLTVFSQIRYMLDKDLGIVKESILVIDHTHLVRNKATFKEELARRSEVISSAFVSQVPGKIEGAGTFQPKGFKDQQELNLALFGADADFAKTLGIQITRGRDFLDSDYEDTSRYVLLNEKAVQLFGWPDDPVGKELINDGSGQVVRVAGVVNDFHLESLHHEVRPLLIVPTRDWAGKMLVKVSTSDLPETIAFLETKWKEFVPDRPFDYFFLDDFYDSLYTTDKTLGELFVILAGLAIVIATLGLLGLSVFMAEQRTREIGIRKVVGATVPGIVLLLISDLCKLILLAMLLATPVTWYLLNQWLTGFAYRIDMTVVPFLAAGCMTLLIAILTIGFQAGKAAMINPVNVLRSN